MNFGLNRTTLPNSTINDISSIASAPSSAQSNKNKDIIIKNNESNIKNTNELNYLIKKSTNKKFEVIKEEEEEITCPVAVRGKTEEKCGEIEEDIFLFPDAVKKQEER